MLSRSLGTTGVKVYPVGFGTLKLSTDDRPTKKEAISILKKAIDLGYDFFDTANAYCYNQSEIGYAEHLLASAVRGRGRKNHIRVATKGGMIRPHGKWLMDPNKKSLIKACEKSLKALCVDHIFIYQLHGVECQSQFEDALECMQTLQISGKIEHIGLCNVNSVQIDFALKRLRIETVQNLFNPLAATAESKKLIKLCEKNKISFIGHSPLNGLDKDLILEHPLVKTLSKHYSQSPAALILNWALSQSQSVIVIPGSKNLQHIRQNYKSATFQISPKDSLVLSRMITMNYFLKSTAS